ncbi:MAG TPA: ABC transporter permease [Blastocatellia bacterium]|nr:ABC transporter permease [Blastocatellia bacterium]
METLWQDLRYGVRILSKQPGFTLIAVITLALGIGANTALFSLVDKLMLQLLPVREPDSLVQLTSKSINPELQFRQSSWADFLDIRARNTVFTDLTASKAAKVNLGEGDQMERVRAELIADNYFALLGVNPLLGRSFTPGENRSPGAHPLAVLSYSLWQSRFGGAANVLGQAVRLNDLSYTIIGIAPASFRGLELDAPTDVWVPAMMLAQIEQKKPGNEWLTEREYWLWEIYGRLKPGVTRATAEPIVDTLARQIRDEGKQNSHLLLAAASPFSNRRMLLQSLNKGVSSMRDEMGQPLLFVFGIVGAILLIACANLAGLLLARATLRRKEIAVRLALGAGRRRLIGQLLTESLLLAGLGGALGILVAPWLIDLLLSFQTRIEVNLDLSINWRVAGFAFALSLLTGVLFGVLPAWQASKPDLIPALKDEGAMRPDGRGFTWSRRAVIVTQIALSLVVLIAAGLFVRTLQHLLAIDPGFNANNVLVAAIDLPEGKYDAARSEQFFQQLRERLQALPGVQSVALTENTPFSGNIGLTTFQIEGDTRQELPTVDMNKSSAGYHDLLGIKVEQGRSFNDSDRKGQSEVVMINAAFAQQYFPNQNPIGKRLRIDVKAPWMTIIGVTRNTKTLGLDSEDRPQIELPLTQHNSAMGLRILLRTRGNAAQLLPQVRKEVRTLDAGLAFFKASTLQDDVLAHLGTQRMAAMLTSLFGVVALLLTVLGLYGVIAYAVNQRTREIGIRMALGAQSIDVLRLVLREGVWLIGVGLMLGVAGAIAMARLIDAFLYGVRSYDPMTFVIVAVGMVMVALLACWIPARRATKVDPMIALRQE